MDIEASGVAIGGTPVARFNVIGLNFEKYIDCQRERMKERQRTDNDMMANKVFNRARLMKCVTAYGPDGAPLPIKPDTFGLLPRPVFTKLVKALDNFDTPAGKIISENGDGVTSPIIYELGTPIAFDDTRAGDKPIGTEQKVIELEFMAAKGSDIEEVLCHSNGFEQTMSLIKTCAKPLGGENDLLRMPSWMLAALTFSDGWEILDKVLPLFVE